MYLIGHDPMADVNFLRKGLNCTLPAGLHMIDTRMMFSAWGGDNTLHKLSVCLDELDIDYWYLHNAGKMHAFETKK